MRTMLLTLISSTAMLMSITGSVMISAYAQAGGVHLGPHALHDDHSLPLGHHDIKAIGEPGEKSKVSQTIKITMQENNDGSMSFYPSSLAIAKGATVRLILINNGSTQHEFVMDESLALRAKNEIMIRYPDFKHEDPNTVHLNAGEAGELIWNFVQSGDFKFACLMPGHFEAGMYGVLTVS